ncbi:hypothetical protein [Schlesneria paludicola]|uniref:hypothetical protein n=1 Tax=Schlesneria paludicola TaxID=360056 RepID=UPI00029B2339|nr:hypothetical protein [Schlesneria paludicola]
MSIARVGTLGLFAGLLITAGIIGTNAIDTLKASASEAKESKLTKLRTEKVEILQRVVNQLEKLRIQKEVGADDLYAAQMELYHAKLDLCASDRDRIATLEHLLSEARRREEAALHSNTKPSHRALERAQVDRLDVEIALEQLLSK